MAKITLMETWGKTREFLIEGDAGSCRFSLFGDNRSLSSFGGSVWPGSFPEVFEHFGPDKGCITSRSGYQVRQDAMHLLPSA